MRASPLSTNSRETLIQAADAPDDPLEADLGERVEHDGRGRALGVGHERLALRAAAEQQFVARHLEGSVEDRLSCDVYLGHENRGVETPRFVSTIPGQT